MATNYYPGLKPGQNIGQELMDSIKTQSEGWGNYVMGGSYMPKWSANDDPYYQRIASQVSSARDADSAQRRSNIQQALIAFGMDPGFNDKFGDVDENTRALMKKNTDTGISGYARLLSAKRDQQKALLNRIGAKGLFRSGAKGAGLKRGQLDFDRSLADSIASLTQNLGGFSSAFANNEMQRQNALQDAMARAYQSYVPPSTDPHAYVKSAPTSGISAPSRPSTPALLQFSGGRGGGAVKM